MNGGEGSGSQHRSSRRSQKSGLEHRLFRHLLRVLNILSRHEHRLMYWMKYGKRPISHQKSIMSRGSDMRARKLSGRFTRQNGRNDTSLHCGNTTKVGRQCSCGRLTLHQHQLTLLNGFHPLMLVVVYHGHAQMHFGTRRWRR